MIANPHILDADQLRELSGKRSASAVRFTHVWSIDVPRNLLREVEAFYIHALAPPWNVKYPSLGCLSHDTVEAYIAGAWSVKVLQ